MEVDVPRVYRQLQLRLDKLPIGFPATESGVEIQLLEYLFTPIEAEIAFYLKLIPERLNIISKRLRKHHVVVENLEVILDSMGSRGIITSHQNRSGIKFYAIAFLAIGFFEFQVDKLSIQFYQLFKQYLEEAFRDEFLSTKIPQLRTVPTEGSIAPDLPIATYDDIRYIIESYPKKIAVTNCICKQGQDLIKNPCKATHMREICMIFDSAAHNYVQKGWGRFITKEECKSILNAAEHDGLVVQPSNSQKLLALCLCCGCCCEILTSTKPLDTPVQYFSSNYYAEVDKDLCIGCQLCEKRCQMDAISFTEKKCRINNDYCIGCGLCILTCPKKALSLKRKTKTNKPPKNTTLLYLNILKKKVGKAKFIIMLTKQLLGEKM